MADVYDTAQLGQVIAKAKPDTVIHQMTALPQTIDPKQIEVEFAANDRVRTEGTQNLVSAAQGADVARVVAQSIAFVYEPTGRALKRETDPLWLGAPGPFARTVAGVDTLERVVTSSDDIEGVVLRYGYFYGPGTAYAPGGSIAGMVAAGQFPIVADGAGMLFVRPRGRRRGGRGSQPRPHRAGRIQHRRRPTCPGERMAPPLCRRTPCPCS